MKASSTVLKSGGEGQPSSPTQPRTERFAVVQDGLLKSLRLTHTGARSFFTLLELMAANLRSLLSAYAGLWTFPAPAEIPTDLADPEVRLEIRRRLAPVQLELFGPAPTA